MDIEQRIKALETPDLQKLLSTLNFALSGSTIGEAGAFDLLAAVESPQSVNNASAKRRRPNETTGSP